MPSAQRMASDDSCVTNGKVRLAATGAPPCPSKVIPAESGASSFLALIRDSSSPLSKAPRCAHKRCLLPSEPLRGDALPSNPLIRATARKG